MKKTVRKKKHRPPRGLTRLELSLALGVSLTSVDRLIQAGLKPVGKRGKAKLYLVRDARRLARRLAPERAAASEILLQGLIQRADDIRGRAETSRRDWLPDEAWMPPWSAYGRAIADRTQGWPPRMAAAAAAARLAASDPRGRGPAAQESMRILLNDLADAVVKEAASLERILEEPSPPTAPPPPKSLVEAKKQLIAARADLSAVKIGIRRRLWRRRAAVKFLVEDRIAKAQSCFWNGWPGVAARSPAGDERLLDEARRVRQEALDEFSLAGLNGHGAWSKGGRR